MSRKLDVVTLTGEEYDDLLARVEELEAREDYAQHRVQTAVERGLLALDKPTDPEAEREALRAILHGIAELARVMEVGR